MIAFEVKSWGRPVKSWTLLADGYRQVETVLSRLPDPIPDYADCANRMTDLPYGTLRLTRGATTVEIAWNSGCMDDAYRAFIATLKAADAAVADWGRAGRVLRTEDMDSAAGTR